MIKPNFLNLASILSLSLLLSSAISSSAIANETDYSNFPTGRHEGGGTRGKVNSCAIEAKNPIPLTSEDNNTLTVSDSPELFFHVPDVIQASTLNIVLLNQNDEVVYQNEFEPGDKPGLVSVHLTDNSNSNVLKVDDLYHWYLVQECDDVSTPKIVANGSLQRIELNLDLASKLKNASPLEKVKLYREANIWHEAIANLANLKCNIADQSMIAEQLIQIDNLNDNTNLLSQFSNICPSASEAESIVMQ